MAEKPTLLIVDDEKPTRDGLRAALEERYDVYVAEDAKAAMDLLERDNFDVLLTDFRLPNEDGMKLIARAKSLARPPVCILMTAYGSEELAVDAMKRGADDYIAKGRLQIDELEMRIARALRQLRLESENVSLHQQLDSKFGLENIVGKSPAMQEIFEIVRQVAPTRATALLTGESGTGKELVAKAIHRLSPRAKQPFVAVHCAALAPTLLESELFGHEKGAFTGAHERRIGRFEQAQGGTLFLDEIGEIDPTLQVKLLRFLGERTFERVGSNKTLTADARLVAATNKNLEDLVKAGTFREDLFFRLRVVEIHLPPLRERAGDIPLLAQSFLREFARENSKVVNDFTADALEALMNYSWPGNVRELRTAIEHAVVFCRGEKNRRAGFAALRARRRRPWRDAIAAAQRPDGEGGGKTIDYSLLERNRRQPHIGCGENRHEPADVSSQIARVSLGRILSHVHRRICPEPDSQAGGRRGAARFAECRADAGGAGAGVPV